MTSRRHPTSAPTAATRKLTASMTGNATTCSSPRTPSPGSDAPVLAVSMFSWRTYATTTATDNRSQSGPSRPKKRAGPTSPTRTDFARIAAASRRSRRTCETPTTDSPPVARVTISRKLVQ